MRISSLITAVAASALLALNAIPAASAATSVMSVPSSTVTSGYMTVSFSGPISFTTSSAMWNPTVTTMPSTGGCTASIVGSYQTPNNPQHIEGGCPAAGTLTGWISTGTMSIAASTGQIINITSKPAPVPAAPVTPYAIISAVTGGSPYTVTLTNTGTAQAATSSYSDTVHTPASLGDLIAPSGWTCSWRMVKPRFGASYKGNGFTCSGPGIPVGGVAVIVSMS